MAYSEYFQKGGAIDCPNASQATIRAMDAVPLGKGRIGIAAADILPGARGSVHTEGVFILPKADPSEALALGDAAYYNGTGVTAAASSGSGDSVAANAAAGWVVEASPAGEPKARVKIG
jgi:predicted RecA/RadA family phage recombinase